ncbi:hypothetical protein [Corallococcus exercitus]|uniref:Lipoprotein n=1 Tax=Corallococcus exercitus TaxID=2316736 RepID=A0A7Y4JXP8_9BACT|nr:hypothetical protein [Corallococcus exercitus]NOK13004.1 hypothetical protein [Corallococcus exercitus]
MIAPPRSKTLPRRAALLSCLLLATACGRRVESDSTEAVGSAVVRHVRTCQWLDWENTSCRVDSVMTAGSRRIEGIYFTSASPHEELALVNLRQGDSLLIDTRSGAVRATLPTQSTVEAWCGDAELVLSASVKDSGSTGESWGSHLEHVWLEHGTEVHRASLYRGPRHVARVLCGPEHTVALVLANTHDGPPIELYRWSADQGLQRVETWPGDIPGGDASDLVLSWTAEGRPDWCARSRPYSLGTCVPPARPAVP